MITKTSPFINENFRLPAIEEGDLTGLTFTVKDVFEIAGQTASLGNPIWQQKHHPAAQTAPQILQLLKQGAMLHGLAISDEFMFSIKGLNVHYGAPLNPKHPEAFTGGSSSGSASAVASGVVDFALGTDTGGSIRVPASYCDLYGFRPSCEATDLRGVAPLAQALDTVGVLANDLTTLTRVGKVLYSSALKPLMLQKIVYFPSTFSQPKEQQWLHLLKQTSAIPIHPIPIPAKFDFDRLLACFQQIQGYEAWQNYGFWLVTHYAELAADIAEHFEKAKVFAASQQRYQSALDYRSKWQNFINHLLADNTILILPTTSSPALPINSSERIGEKVRYQTQLLTSLAGLAGCPQLVIPTNQKEGMNSISFISAENRDQCLLSLNELLTNIVRGVIPSKMHLLDSAG